MTSGFYQELFITSMVFLTTNHTTFKSWGTLISSRLTSCTYENSVVPKNEEGKLYLRMTGRVKLMLNIIRVPCKDLYHVSRSFDFNNYNTDGKSTC